MMKWKAAVIPILDKDIQSEIADKAKKSFELRKESQRILCQAVEFVEMAIEQGEEMALNYCKGCLKNPVIRNIAIE